VREQGSEVDSLDKKDRIPQSSTIEVEENESQPRGGGGGPHQLEKVMETESRTIFTETEGLSFENSVKHEEGMTEDLQGK
jgi:hypothetical protein